MSHGCRSSLLVGKFRHLISWCVERYPDGVLISISLRWMVNMALFVAFPLCENYMRKEDSGTGQRAMVNQNGPSEWSWIGLKWPRLTSTWICLRINCPCARSSAGDHPSFLEGASGRHFPGSTLKADWKSPGWELRPILHWPLSSCVTSGKSFPSQSPSSYQVLGAKMMAPSDQCTVLSSPPGVLCPSLHNLACMCAK